MVVFEFESTYVVVMSVDPYRDMVNISLRWVVAPYDKESIKMKAYLIYDVTGQFGHERDGNDIFYEPYII